jgi:hypothetical protein
MQLPASPVPGSGWLAGANASQRSLVGCAMQQVKALLVAWCACVRCDWELALCVLAILGIPARGLNARGAASPA